MFEPAFQLLSLKAPFEAKVFMLVPYFLSYFLTSLVFCGKKLVMVSFLVKVEIGYSRSTTSLCLPTALTPKVSGFFLPFWMAVAFLMP